MEEDVGEADVDSEEQGAFDGLIMALKDTKIYVLMFTLTAYVVGLSFNAFFVRSTKLCLRRIATDSQPTLTGTLGFSYVPTLLMSAPPWAFSVIVSMINAWHADRTQEKVSDLPREVLEVLIFPVLAHCWSNLHGTCRIRDQRIH
jgi:hypothetical protein